MSAIDRESEAAKKHEYKVFKAKLYKAELENIAGIYDDNAVIVPKNIFERKLNSDFVEIQEMDYIRIATVINYPDTESQVYIWLTPIREL